MGPVPLLTAQSLQGNVTLTLSSQGLQELPGLPEFGSSSSLVCFMHGLLKKVSFELEVP